MTKTSIQSNYKEGNRDFEFFYPNRQNKFWKVLARIAGVELTDFEKNEEGKLLAINERKEILNRINLAITDIGAKVLRQNNSSSDSNLFPVEFSDIFSIISKKPTIKTIILTSSSKGNSVLSWFTTYCEINGIKFKVDKNKKEFPIISDISVGDKKIKVVIVYSTSGAAGKAEDFLVNQYKSVIIA